MQEPLGVMKNLFFYTLMLLFTLSLLEAGAFAAVNLIDHQYYFDHRHKVLPKLTESKLEMFKENRAHPITGWRNHTARIKNGKNCRGDKVRYTYDSNSARTYSGYDPSKTKIILVGDSYTAGNEVADDDTYAATLARMSGLPTANHGVAGFGPVQAYLTLTTKAERYPSAEIAILAIMNENLYRMMNQYRPVLYHSAFEFGVKPYMRDGVLVPHPGDQILADVDTFRGVAEAIFTEDFWAKPELRFPYSLSLARGLLSNYFQFKVTENNLRRVGKPDYGMLFQNQAIELNLLALLNQFATWSMETELQPVAVFIPHSKSDLTSASNFIDRHRDQFHPALTVGDVARREGVDWRQFNIMTKDGRRGCHPTPYGHEVIASHVQQLIQDARSRSADAHRAVAVE